MGPVRNNLSLPEQFLAEIGDAPLLAGFSGGADSTALLLLLRLSGMRVTAVHFEHGLRGRESVEDALWAEEFARGRGIPFRRIDLKLEPGADVEARAREARLRAWVRLTAPDGEFPLAGVVLGHHAGDVEESLLERLARGGNASALAALRSRRNVRGVTFLRPLLGFTRSEIEAFLIANGVTDWRRDRSNSDDSLLRNRIRNRVLPEWKRGFDFVSGGLRAAAAALEADAGFLEECADRLWRERPGAEAGINKVSIDWLAGLHPAMRFRAAGIFLHANGVPGENIHRMLRRLSGRPAGAVPVDREWMLEPVRGFWKLRSRRELRRLWSWRSEPEIIFDGDIYRARPIDCAPDPGSPGTLLPEDRPGPDRAWFQTEDLPDVLELLAGRQGVSIRRDADSVPVSAGRFPRPDGVLRRPGEAEALWLAGVRRTGGFRVRPGVPAVILERLPRK